MVEGLFQPMHLLVIFFIALLVFGPKKLPPGFIRRLESTDERGPRSSCEPPKITGNSHAPFRPHHF